ncbi:MAG: hypothetical protein IPI42_16285 [Saprospiraceae bacterium]|nr:hypothetical protein [Candidatus Parvibacillus calidus]
MKDELETEDKTNQDKIIISLIDVILNYCLRFYNRQFKTRKVENSNILAQFEQILNSYYKTENS